MHLYSLLFPLMLLPCFISAAPQLLGKFPFPHAAFSGLYRQSTGSKYDLLLASFGMFSSDVSIVHDVGQYMRDVTKISPSTLSNNLLWPNEISGTPAGALNGRYVVIPDGFLVPTKTDGSISLYNLDSPNGSLHVISTGSIDWFYHRVIWHDMNKDGTLDALTCRANKPLIGATSGELLWFSNPAGHSVDRPWSENVIAQGPDVFFDVSKFTAGGKTYEVIVVAQFFHPSFKVFWTEDPRQNWSNHTAIRSKVIDTPAGKPFDVVIADVNADGKLDIVATTNDEHNGTVLVYQVPADFRSGTYTRHLLTSGYASKSIGPNKGGPGSPYVVKTGASNTKPSILVAGDDAAVVSLLTPAAPSDPNNWNYARNDFLTTGSSTVGGLSFADVDGDGRVELFVPSYDEGKVDVYRL
ncbi:uncharacterized protein LOC131958472 [Physella acuta]|uniref:uncharacterized protein LOC131958472 n=1 Tax=Physella acuta TaxID=109671 RepID=UPI0027DC6E6D|nr:uncharacterized protein LOC131958472 [Physella acuta]